VEAALCFSLLCLRITARSPLGNDTLSFNPGLVRRHGPVLTYCVFARVAAIPGGSILDEERSATSRGDLQTEALEFVIPPYGVTVSGAGEGIDGALCELADGH
jgi:hypothetical protein